MAQNNYLLAFSMVVAAVCFAVLEMVRRTSKLAHAPAVSVQFNSVDMVFDGTKPNLPSYEHYALKYSSRLWNGDYYYHSTVMEDVTGSPARNDHL